MERYLALLLGVSHTDPCLPEDGRAHPFSRAAGPKAVCVLEPGSRGTLCPEQDQLRPSAGAALPSLVIPCPENKTPAFHTHSVFILEADLVLATGVFMSCVGHKMELFSGSLRQHRLCSDMKGDIEADPCVSGCVPVAFRAVALGLPESTMTDTEALTYHRTWSRGSV